MVWCRRKATRSMWAGRPPPRSCCPATAPQRQHEAKQPAERNTMSKLTTLPISRRAVLAGAAAAGAGVLPALGQAANKKIVLSTWGGDYAKLLTKHISVAVLAPKGWDVVNDEAQVTQRKAKTVAERRLPKGTSD